MIVDCLFCLCGIHNKNHCFSVTSDTLRASSATLMSYNSGLQFQENSVQLRTSWWKDEGNSEEALIKPRFDVKNLFSVNK